MNLFNGSGDERDVGYYNIVTEVTVFVSFNLLIVQFYTLCIGYLNTVSAMFIVTSTVL